MYLSKIQVKNAVIKSFTKWDISRSMKGRICNFSSTGYQFEDKQDGFVQVSFFYSNEGYDNRNIVAVKRAEKLAEVKTALLANGFEFDGVDGFRKAKKESK
jgi:hypothetical protein